MSFQSQSKQAFLLEVENLKMNHLPQDHHHKPVSQRSKNAEYYCRPYNISFVYCAYNL